MKALISSGASSEPRKSIIQETEHISFNDDDKDDTIMIIINPPASWRSSGSATATEI